MTEIYIFLSLFNLLSFSIQNYIGKPKNEKIEIKEIDIFVERVRYNLLVPNLNQRVEIGRYSPSLNKFKLSINCHSQDLNHACMVFNSLKGFYATNNIVSDEVVVEQSQRSIFQIFFLWQPILSIVCWCLWVSWTPFSWLYSFNYWKRAREVLMNIVVSGGTEKWSWSLSLYWDRTGIAQTAGSDHHYLLDLLSKFGLISDGWLGSISPLEIGPMHLSVEGLRPWGWSYPVLQYHPRLTHSDSHGYCRKTPTTTTMNIVNMLVSD